MTRRFRPPREPAETALSRTAAGRAEKSCRNQKRLFWSSRSRDNAKTADVVRPDRIHVLIGTYLVNGRAAGTESDAVCIVTVHDFGRRDCFQIRDRTTLP